MIDYSALIEEAIEFTQGWEREEGKIAWRPFDQPERIRFWNDERTAITDAENIRRHDDIKTWEAAHGHDVRLKCYPEFQCAVIESYAADIMIRLAEALSAETVMTGQIVTASIESGEPVECGLEDCECPEHEHVPPKGTYITVRLDDENLPIGLWRVSVNREVV